MHYLLSNAERQATRRRVPNTMKGIMNNREIVLSGDPRNNRRIL